MKSIVIVGWDKSLNNVGDQILIDTVHFLCENASDYNIVNMDWENTNRSVIVKIGREIFYYLLLAFNWVPWEGTGYLTKIRYQMTKLWVESGVKFYYKRCFDNNECIGVIDAGGALKYKTQNQNYFIEILIDVASKNNIPVMLNALGLEGYSENDIRCRELIKTINKPNVKYITTRDNIDLLKSKFIFSPNICAAKVGDPALWIPEVYQIKRNKKASVIGVNLIREDAFKDYGYYYKSPEEVFKLYCDVVHELEIKGLDWVFFTNGMDRDIDFGNRLIERLGCTKSKLLPISKTPKEYVQMVADFKGVIGGRLHAAITAYSLDVPVTAFVWSEKIRYFASTVGLSDYFLEGSAITGKELVNAMIKAIHDDREHSEKEGLKKLTYRYIKSFCDSL